MPGNFERYKLNELLADEGSVRVYKAIDTENGGEVQTRILQTRTFSIDHIPLILERFKREVEPVAQLNHPNIQKILDYGIFNDKPFLVLPPVEGSTVREMIKTQHQIPWFETLPLLIPVADALIYAHSLDIIHTDIKPENILLTRDGVTLLTNFHSREMMGDETTLDASLRFLGTSPYMAPELVRTKTCNIQSDVYALGTVLYEMITGHTPFQSESADSLPTVEPGSAVPPPSQFVADLPIAVENALLKALEMNPANRYVNMLEFMEALKNASRNTSPEEPTHVSEEKPADILEPEPISSEIIESTPVVEESIEAVDSELDDAFQVLNKFSQSKETTQKVDLETPKNEEEPLISQSEGTHEVIPEAPEQVTPQKDEIIGDLAEIEEPDQSPSWDDILTRHHLSKPEPVAVQPEAAPEPEPEIMEPVMDEQNIEQNLQPEEAEPISSAETVLTPKNSELKTPDSTILAKPKKKTNLKVIFGVELAIILILAIVIAIGKNIAPAPSPELSPSEETLQVLGDPTDSTDVLNGTATPTRSATSTKPAATRTVQKSPTSTQTALPLYQPLLEDPILVRIIPDRSGGSYPVKGLAFSPDGTTLVTGSNKSVFLWNTYNWSFDKSFTSENEGDVRSIAFLPTSDIFARGSCGLILWRDMETSQRIRSLKVKNGSEKMDDVDGIAVSPDGKFFAGASEDKTVTLFSTSDWSRLSILEGHTDAVVAAAFSPDSYTLASGSWDSTVKLWDVYTREEEKTLTGHTGKVTAVAYSPDGSILVSAGSDGLMILWDPYIGTLLKTVITNHSPVNAIAFSPDGSLLATALEDQTVVLWDTTTWEPAYTLDKFDSNVLSLAFSRNEKLLACGSSDGSIYIWQLKFK